MYQLHTTFGQQYNYIHSWSKWSFDDSFLVFVWGETKRGELILKIADIKSLEKKP